MKYAKMMHTPTLYEVPRDLKCREEMVRVIIKLSRNIIVNWNVGVSDYISILVET